MIYLDNNATTLIAPEVVEEMCATVDLGPLNPSSVHRMGQSARGLLVDASQRVAERFGVRPGEVLFTSGATEGLNTLIQGFRRPGHIITSALEHVAVLKPIDRLEQEGRSVTYLHPEEGRGAISIYQIIEALHPETALIVLMAANNETGVKSDIEAIAALAEERGITLIVDGVALLGREEVAFPKGISAMCFSGHKVHGPLGVGFSLVRKGLAYDPLILGGAQQQGRRGGTENLPAIRGLVKALSLFDVEWMQRMESLRNHFERELLNALPEIIIHGKGEPRTGNVSNIGFPGVSGETLLMTLDLAGVAASHGSACASGSLEPSRVLLNMGVPTQLARSSLRFSLGRYTTLEEINQAIKIIVDSASRLKNLT